MIKALLVDGDGIVLKPRDKYFSQRLTEDGYNVDELSVQRFFKEVYPNIRLGKKNLEEEVEQFLGDWNWNQSAKKLLEYWFSYENDIDQEVIDILQDLREQGIKVYLASDHSKYRANDLWENVGMKEYFDGHFFSCHLGATKEDNAYYEQVLKTLQLEANEVAFLDDEEENVETGIKVGLQAKFYSSIDQLKALLQ